ncbi:hypothetical protein [Oryza sativa Japonica Group]|uniref:Uncharacterized protein n=1 Tax=Oryza sativa subsp. japonica TaxID=39947 RepID=Q5JL74_ORYSJ|nr:hypothetical protein [Oryza sativa Japonica Group]
MRLCSKQRSRGGEAHARQRSGAALAWWSGACRAVRHTRGGEAHSQSFDLDAKVQMEANAARHKEHMGVIGKQKDTGNANLVNTLENERCVVMYALVACVFVILVLYVKL